MLNSPNCNTAIAPLDTFVERHIGPRKEQVKGMLEMISKKNKEVFKGKILKSTDELIDCTIPRSIRLRTPLTIGAPLSESEAMGKLLSTARKNKPMRSFIGQGYYNSHMPTVIRRNVLENPAWYTPYTPYQAEISQGRLEAMLNFQTIVSDLTELPLVTSLLDEATAAAEAMAMCNRLGKGRKTFFVDQNVHQHVVDVIRTRAAALNVNVVVGDVFTLCKKFNPDINGVYVQYPNTFGLIEDYTSLSTLVHQNSGTLVAGTDLMALALYKAPGKWADIVVGSNNRFGLPPGNGGPHSGFLATHNKLQRVMPGRIIGVSVDAHNSPALRMALQTREQHIKRENATSNICTSTALISAISGFYAIYHGPKGIENIANSIRNKTHILAESLRKLGNIPIQKGESFDTVYCPLENKLRAERIMKLCRESGINIRGVNNGVSVTFDETTTLKDIEAIVKAFAEGDELSFSVSALAKQMPTVEINSKLKRDSSFLTNPIFNKYHSEHEMTRYLHRLQSKDIGLEHHMIPLGSCTMKLNASSEMYPLTWAEFTNVHPLAPEDQKEGYAELINDLEQMLCEVTQLSGCSLQPNSGAAGEYAGLLTIRNYLNSRGERHRTICLIPQSAHGTNPASAVMAGFTVVTVKCDSKGNIDIEDVKKKCEEHKDQLGCIMITYPSTYGLFEEGILEVIESVHRHGGQVFMDGANMNAQVGLTAPGRMGADVCHLNLHKTFAMPHGGGGPGVGPICVGSHLIPHLPSHSHHTLTDKVKTRFGGAVASGPHGNANLLPISWMYIKMLGGKGLTQATTFAILNSNYMAAKLKDHYNIVYTGKNGTVGHEFIIDCRPFKKFGIEAKDIAKRLMDYGFHGPTMSFPVSNTLMVEPTECESLDEINRLCDAFVQIRQEIRDVEEGRTPKEDNPLVNAPHTATELTQKWTHPYSRSVAVFPLEYVKEGKVWPSVKRVNDTIGDLHLKPTLAALNRHDE